MEETIEIKEVYSASHSAVVNLKAYGSKTARVNISGVYQVGNYSGNSMKGSQLPYSFSANDSSSRSISIGATSYATIFSGWILVSSASVAADDHVLNQNTYASLHGFKDGNWNGRDYMTISALNGKWKVSDGITRDGTRNFYINIYHTVKINLQNNDGTDTKTQMTISTAPAGWNGNAPTDCTWDKPAAANVPSRTGYSFQVWATSATSSVLYTDSSGNWNKTKDLVALLSDYYARWSAKSYTVAFDSNGGSASNPTSKSVTYDSTYGTLPVPTKDGYSFDGWWTAASGETQDMQ